MVIMTLLQYSYKHTNGHNDTDLYSYKHTDGHDDTDTVQLLIYRWPLWHRYLTATNILMAIMTLILYSFKHTDGQNDTHIVQLYTYWWQWWYWYCTAINIMTQILYSHKQTDRTGRVRSVTTVDIWTTSDFTGYLAHCGWVCPPLQII